MIRIDDLGLFVRSAALGSFTAAALEADLLPGQVAAAIKRLERELDVRLFARTTRSIRLTAEGEQYLPIAQAVLETLKQGHENLRGEHARLRGVLQVAAPSDLGRNILLPWLSAFRQQNPQLSLRFFLSGGRRHSLRFERRCQLCCPAAGTLEPQSTGGFKRLCSASWLSAKPG